MGTNYYVRLDNCPTCKRYHEQHIGKNSWGWQFIFNATEINNYDDWVKFLTENKDHIYDEYGAKHDLDEFLRMIESRADGRQDCCDYVDGKYRFHKGEFS
jgi:ABC-type uncharacterized transport system YnjBCD substrate-binding protein